MSFYTNNLKQQKKASIWKGIGILMTVLFLMSLYTTGGVVKERDTCVDGLSKVDGKITEYEIQLAGIKASCSATEARLKEYTNDDKCSTVTCMLDEVEFYYYEDGVCTCTGYDGKIVKVVEY